MNLFKSFLIMAFGFGFSFLLGCEKELKEHPLPESVKRRLEMANDPEIQKKKITGTITLSANVAKENLQGTSLFIFARPIGVTSGPPLAVKRLGPVNLPFEFSIGQMDTMLEGADFSGQITVTARLDRDGIAGAGPGDIEGKINAKVGDIGIQISLNQVVGENGVQKPEGPPQSVSGKIIIEPKLKNKIPENGTLFVFVRPEGVEGGPPLAVKRMPLAGFPQNFTISEKDAMRSTARFEGNLTLTVRVDQDGDARAAPGDIEGSVVTQAGVLGLELVLNSVVGAPVAERGGTPEMNELKTITGMITLDPKIAGDVPAKNLRMFIILRPKNQVSEVPLAVQLFSQVEFPMPFEIGQKDVMMPGTRVEGDVEVVVRIDRDGNAKSSLGDLEGEIDAVVGDKDVKIVLNKKV